MPPRHTYWTILFGDKPTAFRSATQEELLPTFKQIQAKHPDAVMMWFARGKLWRIGGRSARGVRAPALRSPAWTTPRVVRPQLETRPPGGWARRLARRSLFGEGGKPPSGEGGQNRRGPSRSERPRDDNRPPRSGRRRQTGVAGQARRGDRPRGPKPAWRPRDGQTARLEAAKAPKPEWRDKPQGDRPRGPKPEWRDAARRQPPASERRRRQTGLAGQVPESLAAIAGPSRSGESARRRPPAAEPAKAANRRGGTSPRAIARAGPKPAWLGPPRPPKPRGEGGRSRAAAKAARTARLDRPPGSASVRPQAVGDRARRDFAEARAAAKATVRRIAAGVTGVPAAQHKDPRDRFKVPRDVKRARFKEKLRRDRTNPRPARRSRAAAKAGRARKRTRSDRAHRPAAAAPDLTEDERRAALDTLVRAAADIPEVRRFRLGRRVKHGLPGYEQMMTQDYEFALIIEVDDVPALTRYLTAPAHRALGDLFSTGDRGGARLRLRVRLGGPVDGGSWRRVAAATSPRALAEELRDDVAELRDGFGGVDGHAQVGSVVEPLGVPRVQRAQLVDDPAVVASRDFVRSGVGPGASGLDAGAT